LTWKIEYSDTAKGQLRKLDKHIAHKICDYLDDVASLGDPRTKGKALKGPLGGLWRYRVKGWRVICDIQTREVIVLVLTIDHRRKVYGGH
jgi:mRNA interferase RelE/StbE